MQNDNLNIENGNSLLGFLQKNRKSIFICSITIIILIIGFIVYLAISDVNNRNAIAKVEELSEKFDDLRFSINDDNRAEEVNLLLEDLKKFGEKNRGVAAARAFSYVGRIYSSKSNWEEAEKAWLSAAYKGRKTYLGPIAYFNVAVCLEEQGKKEEAIEYLQKSVDHNFEFIQAPRAQFNIGRLYQELGNTQEAIEAYREVLIKFSNLPVWQNMARTAILRLEINENQ